jgi:thiol-disulfide isomerase/thioredoxin
MPPPRVAACLLALLLSGNSVVCATGLDLHAYRGKVVYLDFWASWCGPCRESFPWLAGLLRERASQDLVVIGVNVDKDRALAERFLGETPAAFSIVYDPEGEIASAYKVAGRPACRRNADNLLRALRLATCVGPDILVALVTGNCAGVFVCFARERCSR